MGRRRQEVDAVGCRRAASAGRRRPRSRPRRRGSSGRRRSRRRCRTWASG
ncbi:MAG: hypothetical protein MZV63_65540 [Marinilabiliales bacterium]|nr:hypothetical protein [Marinilabiliales bacterium]